LHGLLRRFVSTEWVEERLGENFEAAARN
jgi:hypothetical protein